MVRHGHILNKVGLEGGTLAQVRLAIPKVKEVKDLNSDKGAVGNVEYISRSIIYELKTAIILRTYPFQVSNM
jgi:hypothetical protein